MSKLIRTLPLGKVRLRNRLVMPPMATEKAAEQGRVSDALCRYYDEKTKGGYFGLVVAEHSYINEEGQASKGQVSFSCDDDVPGLRKLVSVSYTHLHVGIGLDRCMLGRANGGHLAALHG